MDWLFGPLSDVWGVPSFWVQRIAKIVQFVASSVILIDIIGKERVEEWSNSVRDVLGSMARARPLTVVTKDLWETFRAFLLYVFSWPTSREERDRLNRLVSTPYDRLVFRCFLPLAFVYTVVFSVLKYSLGWSLFWKVPLTLAVAVTVSWVSIYLIFFAATVTILLIFRPLEWIFDSLASLAVNLLKRTKLSQLATVISFFLLILGVFFELLAT